LQVIDQSCSTCKEDIGYEKNDLSHVPAIKWGVENENVARDEYTILMSGEHDNFTCNLIGLWINPHLVQMV